MQLPPSHRLADSATAQLLIQESHAQYNNFRQQQLDQISTDEVVNGPPPPLVPPFSDLEREYDSMELTFRCPLTLEFQCGPHHIPVRLPGSGNQLFDGRAVTRLTESGLASTFTHPTTRQEINRNQLHPGFVASLDLYSQSMETAMLRRRASVAMRSYEARSSRREQDQSIRS
jgi:hypothetical protein